MKKNLTGLIPKGLPFRCLFHLFHLKISKGCEHRHDLFQKVQFTHSRCPMLGSTLVKKTEKKISKHIGEETTLRKQSVGLDIKWVRLKLN